MPAFWLGPGKPVSAWDRRRTRSAMYLPAGISAPRAGYSKLVNPWNWLPAVVVVAAAASLSAAPPTGRADDDGIVSQLAEIEPIDTHLHAYQDVPAVADLFSRLNLRALNIPSSTTAIRLRRAWSRNGPMRSRSAV